MGTESSSISQALCPVKPYGRGSLLGRTLSVAAHAAVPLLILLSLFHGYLLFHFLVEIFSIVIACGIFMIAWHTRAIIQNTYFKIIGVGYLFVAGFDLLHTLSYEKVGIELRLPAVVAARPLDDPAIEFWVAGRYLEALTLLAALLLMTWRIRSSRIMLVYMAVSTALLLSIVAYPIFPACFIAGQGLTAFKVGSEVAICLIVLASILLLIQRRAVFDRGVFRHLVAAAAATILAELSFTLYNDMFGIFNVIGHVFKLLSFFLIYRATIVTGLEDPFALLLRDLKLREQRLQTERDFIERVLDRQSAILVVADAGGRVMRVNRAGAELLGRDPARAVAEGMIFQEAFLGAPEGESFEPARATREPLEFESRRVDDQGHAVCVLWRTAPYTDLESEARLVICTGIDVTEQREAERRLIRAERLAAVGTLVAGVAHQFNNINGGIGGFASLLAADPDLSEKSRFRAGKLVEAVERATGITKKLVLLSSEDHQPSRPIAFETRLDGFLQVVRHEELFREIPFEIEMERPLPKVLVDPDSAFDILREFLVNAAHAMIGIERKRIVISVTVRDRHVEIAVRDFGCGIPEAEMDKIFSPFFSTKGENAPGRSPMQGVRGVGLGLAVAQALATRANVEILAKSRPGEGSTFTLRIMRADEGDAALDG